MFKYRIVVTQTIDDLKPDTVLDVNTSDGAVLAATLRAYADAVAGPVQSGKVYRGGRSVGTENV